MGIKEKIKKAKKKKEWRMNEWMRNQETEEKDEERRKETCVEKKFNFENSKKERKKEWEEKGK